MCPLPGHNIVAPRYQTKNRRSRGQVKSKQTKEQPPHRTPHTLQKTPPNTSNYKDKLQNSPKTSDANPKLEQMLMSAYNLSAQPQWGSSGVLVSASHGGALTRGNFTKKNGLTCMLEEPGGFNGAVDRQCGVRSILGPPAYPLHLLCFCLTQGNILVQGYAVLLFLFHSHLSC